MITYDFIKVINNFYNMCENEQGDCCSGKCPIFNLIKTWENRYNESWEESCLEFASKNPEEFAYAVEIYSQENPKPIYPTIKEILNRIALSMNLKTPLDLNTRLDKKTAEIFNILPINDTKLDT